MSGESAGMQDNLDPTPTAGYQPGQKKSVEEYAMLDAEDESLRRWKESLGIVPTAGGTLDPNAPKVGENLTQLVIHSLALESSAIPANSLGFQLDRPGDVERASKTPLTIPEGIEYAVVIRFTYVIVLTSVGREVLSGLKYLHVVGLMAYAVDRLEEMIGSFSPRAEPYVKRFAPSVAPSGFLARNGTNSVRSRYVRALTQYCGRRRRRLCRFLLVVQGGYHYSSL